LYGGETWTIKARDARRITAAEMKYMRTAGYIWTDYKTNSFSFTFISIPYMFRAAMCPSSGELTVSIHLVYVTLTV
jgi:hypothetical protein